MNRFPLRALSAALASCMLTATVAAPLDVVTRTRTAAPLPEQYAQARDPKLLALAAGIFDPTREALRHPLATLHLPGASRYAIVQFAEHARPDASWLAAQGARIVGHVPNNAYLVEVDGAVRSVLQSDARIRFVGDWKPDYKIADGIDTGAEETVALNLLLFRGEPAQALLSTVIVLTGDLQPLVQELGAFPSLRVSVPRARLASSIAALAAMDEVQWIERFEYPQLHNASAVWPIQANTTAGANPIGNAPIWLHDITGTGQIVAVADSGLDRNEGWFNRYDPGTGQTISYTNAENTTPPTPGTVSATRKVYGYFVMPGATGYDNTATCPGGSPTSFHGTHTSGTVAGDAGTAATPTNPNYGTGDGMAPNAQLLFQDIGHDTTGCLSGAGGVPMFEQARNSGAFVHSNSYGSGYSGAYSSSDAEVDQTLWQHDDMLIVFSAGNDGSAATTIGHPGHAKHALTVGALGSGNSTTVASYSSRGPTSDGRRKPDIMAPGTLTSAAGNTENSNPPANPEQANTAIMSGTSMATPAVAGAAALMRQYFSDGFYPTGTRNPADARKPLGTEMKAMLTNGTAMIATAPSNNYGWGRIWLDNNLYFGDESGSRDLRSFARPQALGLATGEQHEYSVQVNAGQEFRATLAWFDPPGTPGAAGTALVNNLDLEVVQGANLYRGNVITGSGASANSTTGGSADALNPLEQVRFTAPTAGVYTVRVKASAVPGDGQPGANRQGYGLAVSSAQCATAVTTPPASVSATNNAGAVDVTAAVVAGASGYQLYRSNGTCATATAADFQLAGHGVGTTLTDNLTQGGYNYAYKVRAVDACGEGPISTCADVLSTAICTLQPTFDQASVSTSALVPGDCGVRVQWSEGSNQCPATSGLRYNVYRSTDPLFVPGPANLLASAVLGSEYIDTTAAALTTYHYVVRAEDNTTGNSGPSGGNESSGSRRVKHTPNSGTLVVGTFSDGADSPSFMTLGTPWSISNDRFATGSYSYRSAADGSTNYNADTCAAITTPTIQLQAGTSVLTYKARYNLETNWDGVVMEVSTNGGAFTPLAPDAGYPSSFSQTQTPPINACGYPTTQGAFSGDTSNAFQTFTHTFSGGSPRNVQIRWRFSSDPGTEEEGFYLDDLQITNASTPGMCTAGIYLFGDGFE
jgi:hypothetical protein